MFQPVSSKVSFPEMEERVLELWRSRDVFRRTWSEREGAPLFMLYEGPPTANGTPGIHHVIARVFKDVIPRYKTMKGYRPFRKGGWDTHGLPVELEVEKELGITTKGEIEDYGIERFNARCRESVMRYVHEWEELTERIGFWIDMGDAYVTFSNDYIETGWWIIKQLWDRGLVYQGSKVTPHCPRCVTSLSSHEVSQGYHEDTPDPSITVRFRLRSDAQDPDQAAAAAMGWNARSGRWSGGAPSVLAWTTTPWTLPANMALAVVPDEEYVLVQTAAGGGEHERLLLARKLAGAALEGEWEVVRSFQGSELVGLTYEPLFPFAEPTDHVHAVVVADFVGVEDGTGVVHIAPAYGADDQDLGRAIGLPTLHTVDLQGRVVGPFPGVGKFVKEADIDIMEDLQHRGLMYHRGVVRHTYPFCWRCDTPLLYYAKPSWYIRTTAYKDELVAANQRINWYPEHIRDGRFGEWLRNNVDWAISRERYWGTPIPIWRCPDCGAQECFGSVEALRERASEDAARLLVASDMDLHRPSIDGVTVPCGSCNGTMERIPEVMDCWYDSGAMPYAQFHYPTESPELFDDGRFPADYICEAVDQTRGWFYSLHALSVLLRGEPSYRNVICLGHILDGQGEKMSKTRGNVVEPWAVIRAHGADALRWYLFTAAPPGNARRFSTDLVEETVRRFLLTLWNTYSFFVTYAELDGFNPMDGPAEPTADLDRWVLSEINTLVQTVTDLLEDYNPTDAGRRIEEFVALLSTWYVRRSRRRFWKSENDADKRSAYQTLYTCLTTLSRLLAPFMPFVAEELYQNLVRSVDPGAPDSVHLAAFPEADLGRVDSALAEATRLVIRVVSLGRAARSKAGVRVRQPLSAILVKPRNEGEGRLLERLADQVRDELNVSELRIIDADAAAKHLAVRLNTAVLGPKYRDRLPEVRAAFAAASQESLARLALLGAPLEVGEFVLEPGEVEVEPKSEEGLVGVLEGGFSVAVDTAVTPELAREGLARELVHRVQNMRRAAGLDIADRIAITYEGDAGLRAVLSEGPTAEYVRSETLATSVIEGPPPDGAYTETLTVESMSITLAVRKR